jgi:hypothetical protein
MSRRIAAIPCGLGDDGIDDFHDGIALHGGLGDRFEVLRRQRERHPVQAGLAIGVVLVENGNLFQPQRSQLPHDQCGFIVVGRAQVKCHAIERFTQCHGTGEWRKKRHTGFGRQGKRRDAGGRSDVAEERKHIVSDQLLGIGGTAIRFVPVVELTDFYPASTGSALGVELVEKQLGAGMKLDAQLGRRSQAPARTTAPTPAPCITTVENGVATKECRATRDHPHTDRRAVHQGVALHRAHLPPRAHPSRPSSASAPRAGPVRARGWDEALDDIAARLSAIAARNPEAILPYSYAGTMGLVQGESMAARFFHRLGASHLDRTICATAGGEGLTKPWAARWA